MHISLSEKILAQASLSINLDIFLSLFFFLSERIFAQAGEDFCSSEDILALAKIVVELECSQNHFRSNKRIFD